MRGGLIMGLLVIVVLAYLASIFLPRQRCPYCNKWFSLPKLLEQKVTLSLYSVVGANTCGSVSLTEEVWVILVEAVEGLIFDLTVEASLFKY